MGHKLGVGSGVGGRVGCNVGRFDGDKVGSRVGKVLGVKVGRLLGSNVGCVDGNRVGAADGLRVATSVTSEPASTVKVVLRFAARLVAKAVLVSIFDTDAAYSVPVDVFATVMTMVNSDVHM